MDPAQPKQAEVTEHDFIGEACGSARRNLVVPDQESLHALIDVVVDRPVGHQAGAVPKTH